MQTEAARRDASVKAEPFPREKRGAGGLPARGRLRACTEPPKPARPLSSCQGGQLWVEPLHSEVMVEMSAIGATSPLPCLSAKVPFGDPLQTSIVVHCQKLEFVESRPW